MSKIYIVSYDIASPIRLRKVHKVCSGYGTAIQYSVFACVLAEKDREKLKAKLDLIIKPSEDQVILICLGRVKSNAASDELPGTESLGRRICWRRHRAMIV